MKLGSVLAMCLLAMVAGASAQVGGSSDLPHTRSFKVRSIIAVTPGMQAALVVRLCVKVPWVGLLLSVLSVTRRLSCCRSLTSTP
jgi:hypothetical protein